MLCSFPGFAGYSERWEVLRCQRPGTGTVDAPRGFSLQLKEILHGPAGWTPTTADLELHYKFDKEHLVGLIAVHVDDLKVGAKP